MHFRDLTTIRPLLIRNSHTPYQVRKPRVRTETIQRRIEFHECHLRIVPCAGFLEPLQRLLFVTESDMNEGKTEWRDITLVRECFQLMQDLSRFPWFAGQTVRISEDGK